MNAHKNSTYTHVVVQYLCLTLCNIAYFLKPFFTVERWQKKSWNKVLKLRETRLRSTGDCSYSNLKCATNSVFSTVCEYVCVCIVCMCVFPIGLAWCPAGVVHPLLMALV